jgi:hypothetical protein
VKTDPSTTTVSGVDVEDPPPVISSASPHATAMTTARANITNRNDFAAIRFLIDADLTSAVISRFPPVSRRLTVEAQIHRHQQSGQVSSR